jgi:hypothetical protein
LGIEQGIEQGKKAAEHDKVYEEVPFYPQPNQTVWPLRNGLAAREARWMRVELSKILTNLGKFELPSSGSGCKVSGFEVTLEERWGPGGCAWLSDGASCAWPSEAGLRAPSNLGTRSGRLDHRESRHTKYARFV